MQQQHKQRTNIKDNTKSQVNFNLLLWHALFVPRVWCRVKKGAKLQPVWIIIGSSTSIFGWRMCVSSIICPAGIGNVNFNSQPSQLYLPHLNHRSCCLTIFILPDQLQFDDESWMPEVVLVCAHCSYTQCIEMRVNCGHRDRFCCIWTILIKRDSRLLTGSFRKLKCQRDPDLYNFIL